MAVVQPAAFASLLTQAATAVGNPQRLAPLYPVLTTYCTAAVKENFARGQSPAGIPWPPLKYRRGKPLLDTGLLRASNNCRMVGGDMQFTNHLIYSGTHNYGRGSIPRREFAGLHAQARARVGKLVEDFTQKLLGGGR